jgi:hypothetical protein
LSRLILTFFLGLSALLAQQQKVVAQAATAPPPTKNSSTQFASAMPSQGEIAAAKSKGLVWTNPTTKVYHKEGEFYGRTKNGKFMSEADAIKQYYRPSPDAMKKADPPKAAVPAATTVKKK